jgi:hypothetical protein
VVRSPLISYFFNYSPSILSLFCLIILILQSFEQIFLSSGSSRALTSGRPSLTYTPIAKMGSRR